MEFLDRIGTALEKCEMSGMEDLVKSALADGVGADDLLNKALIPAMDRVGNRFEKGDLFLPELIVAAETMKAAVQILKPHLRGTELESSGKVIIGTAWKDLHDIGKHLIHLVLEGDGFEIVDLGTSVSPAKFLAAVGAHPDASVLAMSALLTTTMKHMGATIDALNAAGVREKIRVIVGGAPVTEEFAAEIGADAYAADANAAKLRIRQLCNKGQYLKR